jgi:hypothetical protein
VQATGASERKKRPSVDGLGESKLGLLDGRGSLDLIRDVSGAIKEGRGSWRPDNGDFSYDDLRELLRPGATLIYQGPARYETAGVQEWMAVNLEVEITAVERCAPAAEDGLPSGAVVRLAVRGKADSVWDPPPPEG